MRYHIPTVMKQVEQAIKSGKPVNPDHIRVLDAWWQSKGK